MIISDTLRNYLITDVNDMFASAVMALNPGKYASEADVPQYLYKSLSTLVCGSSGQGAELARRIVSRAGEGKTVFDGYIGIRPHVMMDSQYAPNGPRPDIAGSQSSSVAFYFKGLDDGTTYGDLYLWESRVALLLDHSVRSTVLQVSPYIPNANNSSVDSDNIGVTCKWIKINETPNEIELAAYYRVDYIKAFAKTIIP